MIRGVSLLRIRKERILPAISQIKFNTYNSCLTTLLILTAFLTIDFICLFFYRSWKIAIQTGAALFLFTRTKLSHNFASRLYFPVQDSSSFGPSKAIGIFELIVRLQYTLSKLATLLAAVLFFLRDPSIL